MLFISDNNGFDWQFVNYYFHHFLGRNPFGHSSTNLGSLYKGMQRDTKVNFKHLRRTRHTHHPVDDAKGNAEASPGNARNGAQCRLELALSLLQKGLWRPGGDPRIASEITRVERQQVCDIPGSHHRNQRAS